MRNEWADISQRFSERVKRGDIVKAFLWWLGHCLIASVSIVSIFIGLKVLSIGARDYVNFILSLILLVVGVLLLIHFVGKIGEEIRRKRRGQ